jgi:hypothetical protein
MPGSEFPCDGYFLTTAYLLKQHLFFATLRLSVKKKDFSRVCQLLSASQKAAQPTVIAL